ncbi:hypothetical protein ZWY2020_037708 [Hordeum vulgare]|nr:hypothetical protein ZWY2020_037708 [Hordeum vulgare]
MSSDSNVYEEHDDPSGAKHCRHRLNQAKEQWEAQGAKKVINSSSHAHRPLSPQLLELAYYFPQATPSRSPSHPSTKTNIPAPLIWFRSLHLTSCMADKDTDEVYAQMTLQAETL